MFVVSCLSGWAYGDDTMKRSDLQTMASATALAAAANVTAIVDDGRVMQAKTLFSGKR